MGRVGSRAGISPRGWRWRLTQAPYKATPGAHVKIFTGDTKSVAIRKINTSLILRSGRHREFG